MSLQFCHLSWLQTVYTSTFVFFLSSLSTSSKHWVQPKWGSIQGPRYFPQGQGCVSPSATCCARWLITLVPHEEKCIHETVQIFASNCWEPSAIPTRAHSWPTSHVQREQLRFLPSGKQTKERPFQGMFQHRHMIKYCLVQGWSSCSAADPQLSLLLISVWR